MVVIGFGLALAAYAIGMWGYCLVAAYDVPFSGLWAGTWPGGGAAATGGGTPLPADPGTGTYSA